MNVNSFIHDKSFPNFATPLEFDYFSVDEKRSIYNDRRFLKRYKSELKPPFEFDLNRGYETFADKFDSDSTINGLLQWILQYRDKVKNNTNSEKISLKHLVSNVDFISWRGLLTKIAATPYEKRESWIVCVTKYDDIYFLSEFETEQKKQQKLKMTEREKRMTYWGHCFESYVTATDSSQTSSDVSNGEQFCSIVRTKLGDHRLLFGGEVDCFDGETNEYIELKTSRHVENDRQLTNFHRFKLLKWWIQSFLIGINRIICGYRDDDGLVTKLETVNVREIPNKTKTYWSGAVCFNFLHDFLSFIKKNVTENDASKIFKFEYHPTRQNIDFVEADPSLFLVVPSWFTQTVDKNKP